MVSRIILLVCLLGVTVHAQSAPLEISFVTADGVTVFGDWYVSGENRSAPVIVLFHQGGGDARGEYSTIAPRLVEHGFHVLAIDQRNGGNVFDGVNRTIANMGPGYEEPGYCEAYPDMESAVQFIRQRGYDGKLVAWGSSYSAALVFRLAVDHADQVSAIVAFSPASGPPLADCPISEQLSRLQLPALALRPAREFAIESVQEQMRTFAEAGVETYVADPGLHGSSMLNADRVKGSTEETWQIVLKFLKKTTHSPRDY